MRNPRQQHGVIGHKDKTTSHTCSTNATPPGMEAAKDTNVSSLMELTKRNLKDHDGETNDEECHNVGNEEGAASIILAKQGNARRFQNQRHFRWPPSRRPYGMASGHDLRPRPRRIHAQRWHGAWARYGELLLEFLEFPT